MSPSLLSSLSRSFCDALGMMRSPIGIHRAVRPLDAMPVEGGPMAALIAARRHGRTVIPVDLEEWQLSSLPDLGHEQGAALLCQPVENYQDGAEPEVICCVARPEIVSGLIVLLKACGQEAPTVVDGPGWPMLPMQTKKPVLGGFVGDRQGLEVDEIVLAVTKRTWWSILDMAPVALTGSEWKNLSERIAGSNRTWKESRCACESMPRKSGFSR